MQPPDNRNLLHLRLNKILPNKLWNIQQKNKALYELFTLILEEVTIEERLNFTTLFSRLAFVGTKYQLSGSILHYAHVYRKGHEQSKIKVDLEEIYFELGAFVCARLMADIWKIGNETQHTLNENAAAYFIQDKKKTIGFKAVVEAVLFEIDAEKKKLFFYDDDDPSSEKIALYDVHDKNEQFNQNITSLQKTFVLPIHINLIDVDIQEDGSYVPLAIVIQPDHMVDVTAVAECFKDYGTEPFLHLISKFKPSESSVSLQIGNLVNFMLDELISDPTILFVSLLPRMFRINPLGFAVMDDIQVRDVVDKLKIHFRNLQYVVTHEFKTFGIGRENIFLEPSFYSRDFGIQGRLDLLHQKKDNITFDIIELKSGSTFKPNVYGINTSHYIQTLLYDLMIKSAFQTKARSFNYILYSKENEKPLRFAPPVRAQQYEAIKLRNDILAIEQKLKQADQENGMLAYIKPQNFPKLKGFNIKDIENFYNIYSTLNELEKHYLHHYTAFIAVEQSLSKTGEHGINKSNGHAALWLENEDEKMDRFVLLSGLTIIENKSNEEDAFITFARNQEGLKLVNFRVGDIGVLYPSQKEDQKAILKNQIFKCSITDITNEVVVIKLRNRQYNQSLFKANKYWKIEQDSLDSGFNTMYKNLFMWAGATSEFRQLILGKRSPEFRETKEILHFNAGVTKEQSNILNNILKTKDYFLLWGPPGTGKTSVMLKNLVKHLYANTSENIMLLAYTNRAVDEICDAVLSIHPDFQQKFLRLGTRIGAGENYTENLLDQVLKRATSRQEIIDLLAQRRIFVSTVSSVVNRIDLFLLKDFDTVIIDEASQILEPMLVGFLSKFKRFILIGDHKQLPAVVIQPGYSSKMNHNTLLDNGFNDTRTSLFERLYMQNISKGWTKSIGILTQQGRMQESLMEFPNTYFYEGKLKLLPGLSRLKSPLFFTEGAASKGHLANHRTLFIHTQEDQDINWKTNIHEANAVVEVIEKLILLYQADGKRITSESIGIITPYRAQIALIRQHMLRLPDEVANHITVDTVERYQGGARDIIIISFCVNRLSQLETLISPSIEGIDRKLNVALTRAREHIVLLGNRDLLCQNVTYKALIDSYHNIESTMIK
ncbi:MAG: AAA family ATPase [Saprospiraceae bacterium]|nr:AAA family ATPase [Saprospiraceae bacterium]